MAAKSKPAGKSTKPVSLRIPLERLAVIDRAAEMHGLNRTEYVVECSYRAAVASMAERPLFQLNDDAYEAFVEALQAPAAPNDRLRALINRTAPWD